MAGRNGNDLEMVSLRDARHLLLTEQKERSKIFNFLMLKQAKMECVPKDNSFEFIKRLPYVPRI